VTLSINRLDYTISGCDFQYFLNTKSDKTIAYGPGLLQTNATREFTMFVIQARDVNNENRKSGADEFVVHIVRTDKVKSKEDIERDLEEQKKLQLQK